MRITRKQLRQMINEELLREADLDAGSVEILGRLSEIESKLEILLRTISLFHLQPDHPGHQKPWLDPVTGRTAADAEDEE